MMDQAMENFANGKVSKPIDIDEMHNALGASQIRVERFYGDKPHVAHIDVVDKEGNSISLILYKDKMTIDVDMVNSSQDVHYYFFKNYELIDMVNQIRTELNSM